MNRFVTLSAKLLRPCRVATAYVSRGFQPAGIEHHQTQTFEEEFVTFLEKHGVEYDPRY